jgi:hypothetical protein
LDAPEAPADNKKKNRSKFVTRFREAASALDKNYAGTIWRGISGLISHKIKHLNKRLGLHQVGKQAEDAARERFQKGKDRRSWTEFKEKNQEIKDDSILLMTEVRKLRREMTRLPSCPLMHNTDASRDLTDLANGLTFAESRIKHCADVYNEVVKKVEKAITEDKAHLPIEDESVFVGMAGFEARIQANMGEVASFLSETRDKLAEIVNLERYKVVASSKGFTINGKKVDADDITSSINTVKSVVGNLQAGGQLVAILVPEETVSQAFDGATAIGQILINWGSSLAEDWDLKRRARNIMKDSAARAEADKFLHEHPEAVHRYLIDTSITQLSRGLDLTAPAVSLVLAGLSAALDLSGAGAIVAKALFPWVFPVAKGSILTFFQSLEEARLEAAFPDNESLLKDVSKAAAAYAEAATALVGDRDKIVGDVVLKLGQGNDKAQDAIKKIGDETKERLQEVARKGLAAVTPDGLIEEVNKFVAEVVTKMFVAIDDTPPPVYDDLALLGKVRDLAKGSGVEWKYRY